MTRFHISSVVTLLLAALAIAAGIAWLAVAVVVLFFVVFACGIAMPQMRFFGDFVCSGEKSRRQVALTFDDGPDSRSTPQLLDLLRDEKVQCAFFCIGNRVQAEPEIARRIADGGHLVENHSFAHSNFTNFFPLQKLVGDLDAGQRSIATATGKSPKFFRPPVGLSNPNIFRAARRLGLRVIGWNIRTFDTRIADSARIVQRVERALSPGAIILLHDGNIPAERLLVTVRAVIAKIREQGYEIVRLDKLIG